MNDQEVIEHVNKYYQQRECMKCDIWDAAAKEHGKRGMCGECFDMHYIPVECNVERLGMPLLIEWKDKEELLHLYPEVNNGNNQKQKNAAQQDQANIGKQS